MSQSGPQASPPRPLAAMSEASHLPEQDCVEGAWKILQKLKVKWGRQIEQSMEGLSQRTYFRIAKDVEESQESAPRGASKDTDDRKWPTPVVTYSKGPDLRRNGWVCRDPSTVPFFLPWERRRNESGVCFHHSAEGVCLGWGLQGWKASGCYSPAGSVVLRPHGDVLVPVCCSASWPDEPAHGAAGLPGCRSTSRPRGSRGHRRSQREFTSPLPVTEPQARCSMAARPITGWVSLFLAPGTDSSANPQLQRQSQEQTRFPGTRGSRYGWGTAIRSWGCAHLQLLPWCTKRFVWLYSKCNRLHGASRPPINRLCGQ